MLQDRLMRSRFKPDWVRLSLIVKHTFTTNGHEPQCFYCSWARGGSNGGRLGLSSLLKPMKVLFFTTILYNSERYLNANWDLTAKNYWNRPPLNLRTRPWGEQWVKLRWACSLHNEAISLASECPCYQHTGLVRQILRIQKLRKHVWCPRLFVVFWRNITPTVGLLLNTISCPGENQNKYSEGVEDL